MDDSKTFKNIETKLSGLIALTAFSLFASSEEKASVKPEVILSVAGLETREIASILGKNLEAVKKAIQRAKK